MVFVNPNRICPGRYLGLRTVYLVVACVLSVFDIGPALDENGNSQWPKPKYDTDTVRYVFREPSIRVAATFDRHAASHQVSQTLRMYHQASF